ncbi:beta-1,6-N-acetylglucosaminyltransferase [Scheffersomyces xylosifermentans]|uniref:beta-1,6-N-acetylglucosaminyltransferase n=1 Tax=Scheffersomyces xylosifermentans TaxID=1304137 RepID=UPI00315DD8CB
MSNQYIYNSYQQYSPNVAHSSLNNPVANNSSSSPTSGSLAYMSPPGSANSTLANSLSSSATSTSSSGTSGSLGGSLPASNYSFHTPRLRYYLSKSFDIEDDLEFCPDIPDSLNTSPTIKKFNPYTATVFSPSQELHQNSNATSSNTGSNASSSPRVHTPRIKKPLEIINPQTKMRVGSPATK